MKYLSIVAFLAVLTAVAVYGYGRINKIEVSARSIFSAGDFYFSRMVAQQGRENFLSEYLNSRAGFCVRGESVISYLDEGMKPVAAGPFRYSQPFYLGAVGKLRCLYPEGNAIELGAEGTTAIKIERMPGQPFRIVPSSWSGVTIRGKDIKFILRSPRGDLLVKSQGMGSVEVYAVAEGSQSIVAKEGVIEISDESGAPGPIGKTLELMATGNARLLWGPSQEAVTEKTPAVVLPSGLTRR